MLVMLTNRCNENCRHCMSDCKPEGVDMTEQTFCRVINFSKYLFSKIMILSGGELTLNPEWFHFCQILDKNKMRFAICTNGTWIDDEKTVRRMARVKKMDYCLGVQVYTNKKFYKSYDLVMSRKEDFRKIGLEIETSEIQSMKDLGRAKTDKDCQELIENDVYHMSCLNCTLVAKQAGRQNEFLPRMELFGKFCTPCIDPEGKVHMSESQLCPSVGNINTNRYDEIWTKMKDFKPCGNCKNYVRYINSEIPEIVESRKIIGID